MTEETVFDRVKKATVAMAVMHENEPKKLFTIYGTGFYIHSRGVIVTCEHVLSSFFKKPLMD